MLSQSKYQVTLYEKHDGRKKNIYLVRPGTWYRYTLSGKHREQVEERFVVLSVVGCWEENPDLYTDVNQKRMIQQIVDTHDPFADWLLHHVHLLHCYTIPAALLRVMVRQGGDTAGVTSTNKSAKLSLGMLNFRSFRLRVFTRGSNVQQGEREAGRSGRTLRHGEGQASTTWGWVGGWVASREAHGQKTWRLCQ